MKNKAVWSTVCECGCGQIVKSVRSDARYFSASCRKRANRLERGETPPAMTLCACGCGEFAVGRRKLYYSDACRMRAYRKRKDFDDLGPDYEWSKRPETPRKSGSQGYKVTLYVEP